MLLRPRAWFLSVATALLTSFVVLWGALLVTCHLRVIASSRPTISAGALDGHVRI